MAIRYFRNIKGGGYSLFNGSSIEAVSDKRQPDGYPYARVTLEPSFESPNFEHKITSHTPTETLVESITNPNFNPKKELVTSSAYGYMKGSEDEHPSELFTHEPPVIDVAYSDPKLRHVMPTMVGIAMHELGAQHDVPMASGTLSPFSSTLSRNAVSRGLAVPNFSNRNMETGQDTYSEDGEVQKYAAPKREHMPEMRKETTGPLWADEKVPEERVNQGRQWVRDRISASRGISQRDKPQVNRGDSQFEQLKLF